MYIKGLGMGIHQCIVRGNDMETTPPMKLEALTLTPPISLEELKASCAMERTFERENTKLIEAYQQGWRKIL
jgi:hypothetical protein